MSLALKSVALPRFTQPALFRSPLEGVHDATWDRFVRAMSTQMIRDISKGGGIGSFDLRPRRLGELGVLSNMRRDENRRWVGDFVAPYTRETFLQNAILQYKVFSLSMKKYDEELVKMNIPDGASHSGCLAILHCGGHGALEQWPDKAFKNTRTVFDRTNNIF